MPRSPRARGSGLHPDRAQTSAALALLVAAVILCLSCGGGSAGEEPAPQELLIGGPTRAATITPTPSVLGAVASPSAATGTPTRSPAVVSLAWIAGQREIPPLPPFAPAHPDAGLANALNEALRDTPGKISVVVHNLQDGRHAAVNENEVHYAASLFKLGILYEVYRQRDAGLIDLGTLITLEAKYAEHNLGTMEDLGLIAGDMISIGDAARAMAVHSDTPTGVLLQDTVGCKLADETLAGLGIHTTRFCNRELPATAADMTTLMIAVAGSVGVSEASRNEMLSLLAQEYYRGGIIAGLPEGAAVAHKSGSYSGATHDVAVVWGPAGPYVIAVLTDQPGNWATIAKISAAVWAYFANP
jgi:beta-lactamase class A